MSRHDRYMLTLDRRGDGTLSEVHLDAVDGDGRARRVSVGGGRLAVLAEPLRRILSDAGLRGRAWTGSQPIELDRRQGERVELLLRAVKPLRRADRIAAIADDIGVMAAEEASYWHAKCSKPGGLRALRILLSGGGR